MRTNIKMRVTPEQSGAVQRIVWPGYGPIPYADGFMWVSWNKQIGFTESEKEFLSWGGTEVDADLFIRTNGTCEETKALDKIKAKFETGRYIALQRYEDGRWVKNSCPDWSGIEYKLVLKKHEEALDAWINGGVVEWGKDGNTFAPFTAVTEFLKYYNENMEYRVKVAGAPKGHPHAELMAEYAKDAAEMDRPWELWEIDVYQDLGWEHLENHPCWNTSFKYRRKPQRRTVTMPDGTVLPEPVREALEYGCEYFMTGLTIPEGYVKNIWTGNEFDILWLKRGLIHRTEEDAKAWAEYLLKLTKGA